MWYFHLKSIQTFRQKSYLYIKSWGLMHDLSQQLLLAKNFIFFLLRTVIWNIFLSHFKLSDKKATFISNHGDWGKTSVSKVHSSRCSWGLFSEKILPVLFFFFYSSVIFKMLFVFQDVQNLQLKPVVVIINIVFLTRAYVILIVSVLIVAMRTTAERKLTLGPKKAQK